MSRWVGRASKEGLQLVGAGWDDGLLVHGGHYDARSTVKVPSVLGELRMLSRVNRVQFRF